MAETEYTTVAKLPIDTIWNFVKDMDNWAPFLTGYQSHEKKSEEESIWTIKGDAGVLARTVKFQVKITEWDGPERVTFDLKGLNEQMEGGGSFTMTAWEEGDADAAPILAPVPKGFFARTWAAIVRFFFRRAYGESQHGAHAHAGPGEGMARMVFCLRVDPGGPMAPMVNAMIQPAMDATAENLSHRIVTHLESGGNPAD